MPRTPAAKNVPPRNVPGTERYRDERRVDARPKMHGGQWHDHEQPKDLEPEMMAGADAVMEGEGSREQAGTGRVHAKASTSEGRIRRKRTTPVTKGPKQKTRAAQGSRAGMKSSGRAGNPG